MECYLEIIGTGKSIAEAILIKAAREILREYGYENTAVEINSIGDKDSVARFGRELQLYYRKNVEYLHPGCRQLLKDDIFELLRCQHDKCLILRREAPQSMSYLSEPSRIHFKEVLEFLEVLRIPYSITSTLVGNRALIPQTIFEIKEKEIENKETGPVTLAVGLRYNIARKIGYKKDVPAVALKADFLVKSDTTKKTLTNLKKPKVYLIQLGFEAKLKSLEVVETLRRAHIPLCQALSRDKLGGQLSTAENMKIPYAIIMGQKEALENSVIVRNMMNRSQDMVPIPKIADYFKHIR